MAEVLLSLGSNINREHNLRLCLGRLKKLFCDVEMSPMYESEAIGFKGENFFNVVVALQTEDSVGTLATLFKTIEDNHGRNRSSPKFSARTLDIDILTYEALTGFIDGIQLPREEILKNAFVLLPMADLRPHGVYPGSEYTYRMLWHKFDASSQKLWQVPFALR